MPSVTKNCGTFYNINYANPTYAQGADNGTFASREIHSSYGAYDHGYWYVGTLELFTYGGSAIVSMQGMNGGTTTGECFRETGEGGPNWSNIKGFLSGVDKAGLMAKLLPSVVNASSFGIRLTKVWGYMWADGGGYAVGSSTELVNFYNFGFTIPQHAMVYNAEWRIKGQGQITWSSSKWHNWAYIDAIELTLYYATRSGILMKQARRV